MILVVGGTGTLGTLLVRRLVARGLAVRVLTRDPARIAPIAHPNVSVERGDLRNVDDVRRAVTGVETVVAAAHGFAAKGNETPATVDRVGNVVLIDAATAVGADIVLMGIVGATASSPVDLFREKYAAEDHLRRCAAPWTIVRATAFMETWARVMGEPLRKTGRTMVFGRGENPINFVSAGDVAALIERAVVDPALRGEILELGGPANVTFNEFAAELGQRFGNARPPRHIPRPMLRLMAAGLRTIKPSLAGRAAAAVFMDTQNMTFDAAPARRRFPELPTTRLTQIMDAYAAPLMRTLLVVATAASLAACRPAHQATSPSGMSAAAGSSALARIYYWRARPGKVAEYSRYICQLAEPIDHEAQRHGAFVSVTTMLAPDTTGPWTHVRMFKLRDSVQLAGLSKALDDAGIAIEPDSAKRRARGAYSASLRDAAGSETVALPIGDITSLRLPGLGGRPIREGASPCAS